MDSALAATDNILLAAGSSHAVSLVVGVKESPEALQFSWQVVPDDWTLWGRVWTPHSKPAAVTGLINDSTKPGIVFTAPVKEGAYRVYVSVRNAKGYSANANIPFYVIK